MPRADGSLAGCGWSQKRSDAWTRIFDKPAIEVDTSGITIRGGSLKTTWFSDVEPLCCNGLGPCTTCPRRPVPTQQSRDVPTPRLEDELADDQAARDGYNPAR